MSIDRDRAFKLLPRRGRIPILQPDPSGVISPLLDADTQAQFHVSSKKLRRALAGRQRLILCTARSNDHENAFFAGVDEFVAVGPQQGDYAILSPLVRVLGTHHGFPLMTHCAAPIAPASLLHSSFESSV